MTSNELYWRAIEIMYKKFGVPGIHRSEFDVYTPSTLPASSRAALRADMEERIRANNTARSQSHLKAAHKK